MIVQREMGDFALAELLQRIDEADLAKALELYMDRNEPRLLKVGKHRPFKPFKAIRMSGTGPTASEMVTQGRM